MSGSKKFGPGKDFPEQSPSSGKPILQFNPDLPANFIDLLDTFTSYTGKGGKFLIVKESEDGITTAEVGDLAQIADKNYIHAQNSALVLWTVTHNLGKYPSVRIKDATGHSMVGDIIDISTNELTIEFTEPQTGVAIIN
jgi:hypothetical protein